MVQSFEVPPSYLSGEQVRLPHQSCAALPPAVCTTSAHQITLAPPHGRYSDGDSLLSLRKSGHLPGLVQANVRRSGGVQTHPAVPSGHVLGRKAKYLG